MSKKYRVAVIGSTGRGDYGHGLDTAWQTVEGTEVVAVADDHPEGLAKAAERLGVEKKYSDYRKMLAEVMPDIVAICPRWVDQHRDMVVAAAKHGAHIYMEKPFCRTLEEADQIIRACEQSHVKLAIAHPTRYSPKMQTVRKLIADGALGQILEFRGRGKEDHRGGGEDLWVLGSHIMDSILALGGHPQWCFGQVTTAGKPVTAADVAPGNEGIGPLAGDAVHAMFGMPNGATAYFSSVRNAAGKPPRYALQIFGSKGVLEITEGTMPPIKFLPDPSWSPGRSRAAWQNVTSSGLDTDEVLTEAKYRERHWLALTDLIAAIEEDRQPICNMYEGRWIIEMISAVFESHRLGKPVTMPMETRVNPLTLL